MNPNKRSSWSWCFLSIVLTSVLIVVITRLSGDLERYFQSAPTVNGIIVSLLMISIVMTLLSLLNETYWTKRLFRFIAKDEATHRKVLADSAAKKKFELFLNNSYVTELQLDMYLENTYNRSMIVLRYLPTACVTLGLLGTFIGLSMTMTSLANLISNMNFDDQGQSMGKLFIDLPGAIKGMGVAFHTSLYGIGCSLIAGIYVLLYQKANIAFVDGVRGYLNDAKYLIENEVDHTIKKMMEASSSIEKSVQQRNQYDASMLQSYENLMNGVNNLATLIDEKLNTSVTELIKISAMTSNKLTENNNVMVQNSAAIHDYLESYSTVQLKSVAAMEMCFDTLGNELKENNQTLMELLTGLGDEQKEQIADLVFRFNDDCEKRVLDANRQEDWRTGLMVLLDRLSDSVHSHHIGQRNIMLDILASDKSTQDEFNQHLTKLDANLNRIITLYLEQLTHTESSLDKVENLLIRNISITDEGIKNSYAMQKRTYEEQAKDRAMYIKTIADFRDGIDSNKDN